MKSLMVWCANPVDATSFYRGVGPLTHIKKNYGDWLGITLTNQYNWATLAMADALFMQRPSRPEHREIFEIAKLQGKPVWLDYDDDVFVVPRSNSAHDHYQDELVRKNIAEMIALADVVTVSTEALKYAFANLRKKKTPCVVVPNALNELLIPGCLEDGHRKATRNAIAYWRGSRTHDGDMMAFGPHYHKVAQEREKWIKLFIGEPGWVCRDRLSAVPSVQFAPAVDPMEYFRLLRDIKPAVAFVPLVDDQFNRGKSNIAYLEAMYAGSVCVGPSWGDWELPGCLNYKDQKDFETVMRAAIDYSDKDRRAMSDEGWAMVKERYLLRTVNEDRVKVLKELFA